MTAESPAPSPIASEVTTKVTGKVKLMAASAWVPSMPMKKVSTRLNASMAMMPRIMGPVMRSSTDVMGAVSRGLGRVTSSSLYIWRSEFWLQAAQTRFPDRDTGDPSKIFIVRENIFFVFALEGLTKTPHIRGISNLARNGHSSKQHRDSFWESYR